MTEQRPKNALGVEKNNKLKRISPISPDNARISFAILSFFFYFFFLLIVWETFSFMHPSMMDNNHFLVGQ